MGTALWGRSVASRRWCSAVVVVWSLLVARAGAAEGVPTRRLSGTEATYQVLNRMTFGPRPGDQREVGRMGLEKWVRQQLHPDSIDDAECDELVRRQCPSLQLPLEELVPTRDERADKKETAEARKRLKDELRTAVVLRAVYSRRQFREVIVEFWRNHFNVDINKVPFLATHYEEHVLRRHAFGKFEDLLLATAKHPAMLVYLDNHVSTRHGLNENYARELMELHTLGVDNYYKQTDVVSLARALTGWSCGWRNQGSGSRAYAFQFKEGTHDTQPLKIIDLDLSGQEGQADGEAAIKYLANHPGTAHFVSAKLCRYLVSDSPSEALVERVAKVFRESGGELSQVYEAIVQSPEFNSPNHYRTKFKTPLEFVVSVLRATDARISDCQPVLHDLQAMGQPIYECVEPTGYADQREAWLDPGVMVYRWNFAINLVSGKIKGLTAGEGFLDELSRPAPAGRARAIMKVLLPGVGDRKTEQLIASAVDVRAQVALALGAPAFQQQ